MTRMGRVLNNVRLWLLLAAAIGTPVAIVLTRSTVNQGVEVVVKAVDTAVKNAETRQTVTDQKLLDLATNNPPVFTPPPQALFASASQDTPIDLSRLFFDPDDGDTLSFRAHAATPDLFQIVGQQDMVLTVRGKAEGIGSTGTLTVYATDQHGKTNSASIAVRITDS